MGWLWSLGRFRLVGGLVSLASVGMVGGRFAMVMDRQGSRALQQCVRHAVPSVASAGKVAHCLGTAAIAIWTRRAGQLVSVTSIR
jgi:hypothetical protein